ncbi:MAG: tRNA lysidine(34) synthetase TilS [Syntrophobacteria bacterium]
MLLEKVHNTVISHRMLQSGDLVVVAVSGGPDSVALCHLLHRLRHSHKVELVVAHVHHGLRGVEADQDALFVHNLSHQLGLAMVEQRLEVRSWQKKHGGSLQMAARALRYQYLHQIMAEKGASKLAMGHNADDQAEEILLRILRGAGQRGLSGMDPCTRNGVIRPLLECHRHEIMAYLEDHGLAFRQDSSNLKPWCQRNLLRLEFLPQLQQAFNSNLNATLLRTSKIFREEEDFWESHLASWLKEHSLNHGDGGIRFPIRPLLETHPAMQKRLLRRVVLEVKGDLREFGFHHTEILLQLCRSPAANRQLDLPGAVQVEKSYDWVTVTLRHETVEDFTFRISDHGVHSFPLLNHSMEVALLASDLPVEFSHDPNEAIMDLDRVSFPLTLRSSKTGDRFRPLGLRGSKKLKDFFIDAKVPKSQRRQIPILCSKDHIIWVVGHRLDDRVKLTSNTSRVLRLRYLEGLVNKQ